MSDAAKSPKRAAEKEHKEEKPSKKAKTAADPNAYQLNVNKAVDKAHEAKSFK